MRSLLLCLGLLAAVVSVLAKPHQSGELQVKKGDINDVKFYMYTRKNGNNGQEFPFDLSTLDGTDFDASRPRTFVVVHGFVNDIAFTERFVDDLLQRENCNIIGVDWGLLASWTNYFEAAENALDVGTRVGELVSKIIAKTGLPHSKIHAIGHSLGAQALGHLGRKVKADTGSKVARLSGLDPARPYFEILDPSLQLNKNDGEYVDVIHTNSGSLIDGCLSFMHPMGHADFYPAGGDHQPGCTEICLGDCTENDLIDLIKGGCSHDRAVLYFIESINSNRAFNAVECSSWEDFQSGSCSGGSVEMGFDQNSAHGTFYLDVNRDPPFAAGL